MEWTGRGLVIGARRHGETSVIVEAMVEGRGRHMGLVKGGRSRKISPSIQPGNSVQLTWRARIEDHLGNYAVELLDGRAAALIEDRTRLYALQLVCAHLHLLPERDPHDRLLGLALEILDASDTAMGTYAARFELTLLEELGFGLDLDSCAVTGVTTGLTHVSPRSGRAVCLDAAAPHLDRLLVLPPFLLDESASATAESLVDAFALTGHFLDMHVWSARGIEPPPTREQLIALFAR